MPMLHRGLNESAETAANQKREDLNGDTEEADNVRGAALEGLREGNGGGGGGGWWLRWVLWWRDGGCGTRGDYGMAVEVKVRNQRVVVNDWWRVRRL